MAARFAKWELETSQGNGSTTTGVHATPFYLPATEVRLDPKPKPLDRSDEQRGIDGRLQVASNSYEPEGESSLRGYANYLGAQLMTLFGDVVTTSGGAINDPDGNAIPAGCYRHVFTKLAGSQPKSARVTLSYGDEWIQGRGVTVPSMAFEVADDGVKGTCDLMANYLSRLTSAPGDTPSYDSFSILPWRRRNVELTWGVGTHTIESIEFTLAQSLEYVWSMGDTAQGGFPGSTDRANSFEGFLALTGSLTRRQFDEADWDALVNSTAFALKVLFESEQNIGATAYPYRMWVLSNACQYTDDTLEGLKNQPRHQQELNWQAGASDAATPYSEAQNKDFTVIVVNGQPSYE